MDLIGSIHYIENRLERRKPNQGRDRRARKKDHRPPQEPPVSPEAEQAAAEEGGRLGRKIDTTA